MGSRGVRWRVRFSAAAVEGDVEKLEAEHGDEEDAHEDLAGLALGEPAVEPEEDHAEEEEDGEIEEEEGERGGGEKGGLGDACADGRREQGEGADGGGDIEEAEEEADEEVGGEAEGEANEHAEVEGGGGGLGADGEGGPDEEYDPQEQREVVVLVAGDDVEAADACGGDRTKAEDGEKEEEEDAGDGLAFAAFATEGVEEETPAEPCDGFELLGLGWGQPSHVSSLVGVSVPWLAPTTWMKISSRVR